MSEYKSVIRTAILDVIAERAWNFHADQRAVEQSVEQANEERELFIESVLERIGKSGTAL